LEKLPTFLFRPDGETVNSGALVCAICLDTFKPMDELRVLPCNHQFHKKCVDSWLLGTNSQKKCHTNACPVCKIKPRAQDLEAKAASRPDNSMSSPASEKSGSIPTFAFMRVGALLMQKEQVLTSKAESQPDCRHGYSHCWEPSTPPGSPSTQNQHIPDQDRPGRDDTQGPSRRVPKVHSSDKINIEKTGLGMILMLAAAIEEDNENKSNSKVVEVSEGRSSYRSASKSLPFLGLVLSSFPLCS